MTAIPSTALWFGNEIWDDPNFSFATHPACQRLLALDPAEYDFAVIDPWGLAPPGENYKNIELFLRFPQASRWTTLWSFQGFLRAMQARGKRVIVYYGGFENLIWETYLTRRLLEAKLYEIFMWCMDPTGILCELGIDMLGGTKQIGSVYAAAANILRGWGFVVHAEAFATPRTTLESLPSLTSTWAWLASPETYLRVLPPQTSSIIIINDAGIGDPDGAFLPAQNGNPPVYICPSTGNDFRRNFVPHWRERGQPIVAPLHFFDEEWWDRVWNATTDDIIPRVEG